MPASVAEIESLLQLYGDAAGAGCPRSCCRRSTSTSAEGRVPSRCRRSSRPHGAANAGTLVCEVFQAAFPAGSGALSEETLHGVAKAAKASLAQQLAVGLGLARSHDSAVSMEGIKFLKTKLSELGSGAGGGGAGGGQKEGVGSLPAELAHALLFFLDRPTALAPRAALASCCRRRTPRKLPLALLPLLWTADRETGDLDAAPSRRRRPRAAHRADGGGARRGELLVHGRPRTRAAQLRILPRSSSSSRCPPRPRSERPSR